MKIPCAIRIPQLLGTAALCILLSSCSQKFSYKETAVPEPLKMSNRLQTLFAKTKLVCFGRYAMEVPQEAELLIGETWIPSPLKIYDGDINDMQARANAQLEKLKREKRTSEVQYDGTGPGPETWQIRFFESEYHKEDGTLYFFTFIHRNGHIFVTSDAAGATRSESQTAERQASFFKRLRIRSADEMPREPGYCVKHAFISHSTYGEQELINAGIFLPSLPDVSFSVSSNKNAYMDYDKEEFEKRWRLELSLLGRIEAAKKGQPLTYPHRDVLREGKRDVHHWHGEESLYKRKDGTHDFEWALVGTPQDVANPSEFNAQMYSKVAHNTVGAAPNASLTDDEAVALFDRLLAGLKFRVKVPGAPEGSYYFPENKPATGQAK